VTVDELALRILRYIVESPASASRTHIVSPYTWRIGSHGLPWDQVEARVTAAWELLLQLQLIREDPSRDQLTTASVTERGRLVAGRDADLQCARAEVRIAMGLHPLLDRDVKSHFMRGDYPTAAFEAMREVEIQVRKRAELDAADLGQDLMRKAFNPETGAFADPTRSKGENEAASHLFAGAIGLFKNPVSHRRVEYADPMSAADVLLLADLLLRELDGIWQRILEYRRFIRDEVGDGSGEVEWPPGLMGLSPRER
jgi:uncharacterized protein (TIGR02391 family)